MSPALARRIEIVPDAPQRRPRLLMSAARHGLADYRRDRDLPRLLRGIGGDVVEALARLEEEAEAQRRAADPLWSCMRHVELLIALLAERRLRGQGGRPAL